MIIEITIIVLSLIFVGVSWSLNNDELASISKKEEKGSPMDNLLDSIQEENMKSKKAIPDFEKETSQIDDLLGDVKTEKTTPKKETIKIECPGCSATMELQKTGKLQDIVCDSCGLKGELEV